MTPPRLSLSLALPLLAVLAACNEEPGAPAVAIGPELPTTMDDLVVEFIEEAVDPNGNDEVTYTYVWSLDGAEVSDLSGDTVPADRTRAGQLWSVRVIPSDGKLTGLEGSAFTEVQNTPPTATATIAPESPLSTDDLELTVSTEDADGDTVNVAISWTVDGEPAGISGPRVPNGRTTPDEVWEATVLPSDARGEGEPFTVSVQIENQAPVMEQVLMRPAEIREASVVEALPSATDPDRDELTYTYEWFVNGVSQGQSPDDSIDGSLFDRGDTIEVSVVASDGRGGESEAVRAEAATVLNTAPAMDSVSITPTEAFTDTELTCTPVGWRDDDGDEENYIVEWTVNTVVAGTGLTLDPSKFSRDDRIGCTAIPFDGIDEGRTQSTRPITIQNSLPSLSSVTIGPKDPPSGTAITATLGGLTDADGDEVSTTIDWYVNGSRKAVGATLPAGGFIKGDTIEARVTPDDGTDEGSEVTSNTLTAVNSAPRITAFALEPAPLFSKNDATVSLSTDDWDGDKVDVEYAWTINGTAYGTSTTTSVPSADTKSGDVVAVTVSTNDGTVDGDSRSASQKVKLLIDPPEIAIDPENPENTEDLWCEITKGTSDADGGKITYHFTWYKDGTEWTGSTSTTTYSGDTIPSSATADNQTWECEVYASSPNGASVEVSDEVLIGGLQTWSFTDSSSKDDVTGKSLYDFFDGATYDSTYYISFELDTGTSRGGQWCAERADWYADEYIKNATTRTSSRSGSWDKWHRAIGGSWSSAVTTSYTNYWGPSCDSDNYSWCSAWGLGGRSLGVMPNDATQESYASGFTSGTWDVTIQIAPSRKVACGF